MEQQNEVAGLTHTAEKGISAESNDAFHKSPQQPTFRQSEL